MQITKIVSGGPTGADRGGLDATIHAGLPCGGWCPKGRRADDGFIPAIYELQETNSSEYPARTRANVVDSDATIIFTRGPLEGGSLLTAVCCEKHGKPWLHVDMGEKLPRLTKATIAGPSPFSDMTNRIANWLEGRIEGSGKSPKPPENVVLNVAGQRERKSPGIQQAVKIMVLTVIVATKSGFCSIPYEEG